MILNTSFIITENAASVCMNFAASGLVASIVLRLCILDIISASG